MCTLLTLYTAQKPANAQHNSQSAVAHQQIRNHIKTNNIKAAQLLIDALTTKRKIDADLFFLQGRVFQEQKKNTDALLNYTTAIYLEPKKVNAYINRALVRGALLDLEGAMKDLNQALAIEPRNQDALLNRGVTLASLGKPKQAIEDLNKAIKINPSFADAYLNIGIVHHLLGEKAAACQNWQQATRLGSAEARRSEVAECGTGSQAQ
ncbi:tetratricopeptide repeat protein [Cyanobium sp. HWJ4-Hawea]|nr:tetratricopeptide repeat protein [Cyanobium sp. HWJ4-Hawea]